MPVRTILFDQDFLAAMERPLPDYPSVLLLVAAEDLSYAEAADVLDTPVRTIMSRAIDLWADVRCLSLELKSTFVDRTRDEIARVRFLI